MKAILFDKMRTRKEMDIDLPTETVADIMLDADSGAVFKVTYSLQMYDNKKRPVYVESSRSIATTEEKKQLAKKA